uniref:DEAD/DEAH box helicase domain protein n=2 Tax=Candidatus Giovannoniibacteriota TaxID=1752738 RepID=A0A0G0ZJA4_9BACT|nr:MAG: DEAD/DEAH box helicase domain protein [Candidatus Giovannonibacteria bacterium GW2011_GWF2_42_19]
MQRNINANTTKQATFYGLGIAPRLLDIIASKNFVTPTPIQEKAIPVALEGKDIIGIAQTGTGKTLAFGIPMIQKIAQERGRGMIILPTRELAHQVEETLHLIGRSLNLRTVLLIGGASMKMQMQALARNPHIIVGTPGRINDHLMQKTLSLQNVSILVLDEADRMLDMGFLPQIRKILAKLSKNRQTMLFSATMPDNVVRIATEHMKLPFRVEIARPGTTAERVEQELFVLKKEQKISLLEKMLEQYRGSILVFSRTKHGARKICHSVRMMGHSVAEIHSDRSLSQRREALEGFKSGKYRILIATDIASRGIDVTGIELVINFDLPENPEDYVHRIGRTARAGAAGRAISFATPEQKRAVRDIEGLLQTFIIISKLPELPPVPTAAVAPKSYPVHRRRNFYRRR